MSLLPPEWEAEQRAKDRKANGGFKKPNPCIRAYGLGPDGKICGQCHLLRSHSFAKTYHKCSLRGDTRGAGTDHLVRWPACGKFVDAFRVEPMVHRLKIVSPHYEDQAAGRKHWELRQEDDRFFMVGDTLELEHWTNTACGREPVRSSEVLVREVVGVLRGPKYGLMQGWVILSTRKAWGCP